MIVGGTFDGDDDAEIMLMQHEVYGNALGTIMTWCNSYTWFARELLHDQAHPEWGRVDRCDHRTLQDAHDILAGAWRHDHSSRQLDLPFTESDPDETVQRRWLDWLANEVHRWLNQPRIIRSVQLILANQNQTIGYLAEARLCLDILDRFSHVPWRPSLRRAHEQDLLRNCENLLRDDSGRQASSAGNMMCDCTKNGHSFCFQVPCRTKVDRVARERWVLIE